MAQKEITCNKYNNNSQINYKLVLQCLLIYPHKKKDKDNVIQVVVHFFSCHTEVLFKLERIVATIIM